MKVYIVFAILAALMIAVGMFGHALITGFILSTVWSMAVYIMFIKALDLAAPYVGY